MRDLTLGHCWPSCTGRGLRKAGSWLLAAKCSNPFPNVSWLKLSELVINFTKALRCAETQYHISANFKLHIQTSSLKTFPPNVTLGMFTHRAPVSIPLLLSSACFGFTVWISLQHQHPKHALSKNTLPMHSPGTTTSAWTQSECNCCRCHHSLSSSTYQEG